MSVGAEASCSSTRSSSIVDHFLHGRNLRKVFSHLCNHASGQVTDPISYVAHTMITSPVQMVISEVRSRAGRGFVAARMHLSLLPDKQMVISEAMSRAGRGFFAARMHLSHLPDVQAGFLVCEQAHSLTHAAHRWAWPSSATIRTRCIRSRPWTPCSSPTSSTW